MRNFLISSIFGCIRPRQQAAAPGERQVEAAPEPSTLSDILSDVWDTLILPQLKSPYLEVIEGKPTEEQKSFVTACTEQGEPCSNAYHLIINRDGDETTYQLGFAIQTYIYLPFFTQPEPNVEYVTKPLNPKGVLYRLLREDLHLFPVLGFADSTTKDRFILKYLYREIEELGGLTQHPMAQVAKLTATDKNTKEVVAEAVQQEALWWYLHHVAYSELEEAKNILQSYPEFLRSEYQGEVVDSTRERTFFRTTGLQLAVWNRDWHMYNMMFKCIPDDQTDEYKADMYQQLEDLEENGLESKLDNLKHNGLRIVEADEFAEREEYFKENIERRNAYLLIRDQANKICALGFCGPKTGKYRQENLSMDNALYQFVFDEQNSGLLQRLEAGPYADYLGTNTLPFLVTRDERVLHIARDAIETLGGKTTSIKSSSTLDLSAVEAELGLFIDSVNDWTPALHFEQGIVMIDGALRSFSAKMWNWWLSREFDWEHIDNTSFNCAAPGPGRAVDYNDFDFVPVSNYLGGVGHERQGGSGTDVPEDGELTPHTGYLKIFCQVAMLNYETLKGDLEPSLTNRPVV